jgi:hypothetical protein
MNSLSAGLLNHFLIGRILLHNINSGHVRAYAIYAYSTVYQTTWSSTRDRARDAGVVELLTAHVDDGQNGEKICDD